MPHAGSEERRTRIRAVLITIVPELSEAGWATALQAIESQRGIGLRDLDEHLAAHPGALTSGDPRCPLAVVKFTRALNAAGHTAIVPPGCLACGRNTVELPFNSPAGRSCRRCYVRANEKTCARCGQTGHIAARREEGGICRSCYVIDPQVLEECGACGRARRPPSGAQTARRSARAAGDRLPAPARAAALSSPLRSVPRAHTATPATGGSASLGGPAGGAGSSGPSRSRQPRTVPTFATTAAACCHRPPARPAVMIKPGYNHAVQGFVCRSCRPHHEEPCSDCGQLRRVHARWARGPVCPGCYVRILSHPARCPQCGTARPLIARAADGTPVCGPCTGIPDAYLCSGCGSSGRLYAKGLCARCLLPRRLRHHLAGPDGQVSGQLAPVLSALTAAKNPHGVLWWLQHSPNARLLAELAASGEPLSHDLLDDLPPSPTEYYVRQILVHTAVLPERNDALDRIPAWLTRR